MQNFSGHTIISPIDIKLVAFKEVRVALPSDAMNLLGKNGMKNTSVGRFKLISNVPKVKNFICIISDPLIWFIQTFWKS